MDNSPKNQLADNEIVTEIYIRLFGHTDMSFR